MLVVGRGLEENAAERFNGNHAAAAKLLHYHDVSGSSSCATNSTAPVLPAYRTRSPLSTVSPEAYVSVTRRFYDALGAQKTRVAPRRNHTMSARSRVNDAQRRAKRSSSLAALGRRKRTIQMSPASVVIDRTVSKVRRPSGLSL